MKRYALWEQYKTWNSDCKWVPLSHMVSAETPHWDGFPAMNTEVFFDFATTPFSTQIFSMVGQYGTHADAPGHFIEGARLLDTYGPKDMVMPLCVIDLVEKVKENEDYALTVEDILAWEKEYCKIPEHAFVAFRSDWSKRKTSKEMDNCDKDGNKHYPGWSVEALEFLFSERNIGAIGHETSDTDPAVLSGTNGYAAEMCVFKNEKFQIELMCNLDQCPAAGAIIFCTFPKVKDASGFTACCFALCMKK